MTGFDNLLADGCLPKTSMLNGQLKRLDSKREEQVALDRHVRPRADDAHLETWLRQVYRPVDRSMGRILKQLKQEIRDLSADPYDDELMEGFQGVQIENRWVKIKLLNRGESG